MHLIFLGETDESTCLPSSPLEQLRITVLRVEGWTLGSHILLPNDLGQASCYSKASVFSTKEQI